MLNHPTIPAPEYLLGDLRALYNRIQWNELKGEIFLCIRVQGLYHGHELQKFFGESLEGSSTLFTWAHQRRLFPTNLQSYTSKSQVANQYRKEWLEWLLK